ncbi:serine-type D-Ala-D-Ala carboxypeptidase [Testudinibacter sp. TR-2022]|uniref:serine hydrolase n=1 Tax=Testudinibacter sp. TR-2022 TaxID=2585029 RepID=UPI001117B5F7|nr:serine hydrolase [Testudinibacter sp. TR-2022]TNH04349.1 serine-type D-Ala-D-Ala carboxypeptidase [Pasteurellaceae bacterium Phil31]TNH10897.1 serine-type D-Ala-D-Ala carboxypeptidase [Testudinibacter sp. TR-2022]TNH11067.1 serine-type D-Ala-D-Ala carboxypeptidase [Testudinibacter sp. TR-2022]TNH12347.1 serine-type D-Ala-D-Ala carboxypeptidase [Testudinibacter sp. TR-2022]TNH19107.1 serine-type D-Ala-D-Ala carboxypeptidase [Testudinibacter sp. TR-2022]
MFYRSKVKTTLLATGLLFATSGFAADEAVQFNIAPPQLNAQTFILMDYHTGAVLAAKEPDQRQAPASLTKIMTSYVVGDAIKQGKIRNEDMVTVSENAWGRNFPGSSKMFLNVNQQVSVSDLNHGIIIASGNDACVAIAEHIAGTEKNFIDIMNQYVQKFGLKNTHFATVHGLDAENQYSSARDMAIMASHMIRDLPEEYAIHSQKEFTFNKIKQQNRNGLLWDKTLTVDGVKTGHTDQAGYNLVASAVDGDTRFITVVMGVPTIKGREVETKKLLQWGFNNFETLKPLNAGTVVSEQTIYYGKENKVKLGTIENGYITIPKGKQAELKARYELSKKYLEAPLQKGDVVGQVIYQLDGKDVATINLQVLEPIEEAGFFGKIIDWIILTVKSLFS